MRSPEVEAQLAFVFDALVEVDENEITEEDGARVAEELGIDVEKWAKDIQRKIDLYDFPSVYQHGLRVSPCGVLGPYGLGDGDIGGPPPAEGSNLASFCYTHHFTSKKGKPAWTTRYYLHHWNPIGGEP